MQDIYVMILILITFVRFLFPSTKMVPFLRRENLESILLGYWERGMTDLSSQSGKQLATEALHNNPGINRKQIKVHLCFAS